jgi:hypothetical protein
LKFTALSAQSPAILEKFRIASYSLGSARPESPVPQQCPAPKNYGWWQAFTNGWLYYTPAFDTVYKVTNPIFSKWGETGWEQGELGFPIFSMTRNINANNETIDQQIFEGGYIWHNYVNGQTRVEINQRQVRPGRYRLILCGFKVEKETNDDPFEMDGKGDEIYIRTDAYVVDEYKNVTKAPYFQTRVMGDVNNQTGRIRAGSRSVDGGLRTDDPVPKTDPWRITTFSQGMPGNNNRLPLKIWEGEITQSNYLIVVPSVWEWDEEQSSYFENRWTQFLNEATTLMPRSVSFLGLLPNQMISTDKLTGNTPIGLGQTLFNNKTVLTLLTPVFVASRRTVYFGTRYNYTQYQENRDINKPDIFEAVFESKTSPFGRYRLYLKWEKL